MRVRETIMALNANI